MTKISILLKYLKNNTLIRRIHRWLIIYLIKRNHIIRKGSRNRLLFFRAYFYNSKVTFIGHNNTLTIGDNSRISNYNIFIQGNNNIIEIEDNCILNGGVFWIEENQNKIYIGKGTTIEPYTQLACIEGRSISIGKDCMFSSDVIVRTGDSHSVTDLTGNRINPSKNVEIGNHVWLGQRAIISKGSKISSNSIVGAGSFVNKVFERENIVIAGIPAKVINENVNWERERF